ncbi:MAG: glycosyltransferase family 2 protein [Deltaproteobacteria bacterium]|nr:glycosyltransferase family 2 protein [Deltaproteobacteria bacterium]
MRLFKTKISAILPAYNEGHHIYDNLLETHRVLKKSHCDFEIMVVDDGSKDNTYTEAVRVAKNVGSIIPIKLPYNCGKGSALKNGFKHVTGSFVVFLDADLDLHPHQIYQMFRVMRDENADVVIGSKYHPESKLNYPLSRKIFSRIYAFCLKMLFGLPLRDTQTGLKIFRYEVLANIFPRVLCKRYAFDVELLANAHHAGYKVVESPIVLNYRREMKWGRIGLKDMYYMGMDTLAIFYRMYILRYYDRVSIEKVVEDSKDCEQAAK